MKSSRDMWVTALIPAIFLAGGYMWFSGRARSQLLGQTEAVLESVRRDTVSESQMQKVLTDLAATRQALEKERATAARIKTEADALAAQSSVADKRQSARQNLAELLAAQHLTVLTSLRNASAQPRSTEELRRKAGLPPPELWRVEAVGTYNDMRSALEALAASPEFIIPVSVELRPVNPTAGYDPALRTWVLNLWL